MPALLYGLTPEYPILCCCVSPIPLASPHQTTALASGRVPNIKQIGDGGIFLWSWFVGGILESGILHNYAVPCTNFQYPGSISPAAK